MLVNMIIVALVMGLMATSFAQLSSGQFASADAYRTSYQAQQLVEAKANEIAVTSYTALAGEARAAVTGATEWQREVILGAETDLGGGNMQRPVTINVYKDAETIARASVVKYPTSAGTAAGVPTGMVAYFQQNSCPAGWLAADGSNGSVDVRGEFIRGLDNGRGVDIGRLLGSFQLDAFKAHYHVSGSSRYGPGRWGFEVGLPYYGYSDEDGDRSAWAGSETTGLKTSTQGIPLETRPRNIALLGCIKQ